MFWTKNVEMKVQVYLKGVTVLCIYCFTPSSNLALIFKKLNF